MNLVRFHHPYSSSVNQNLVNDLFNNLLQNDYDENYVNDCNCKPATNILETEKDFRLELQLAGFKKEDVQMSYHENVLTVKVELPEEKENNNDKFKYEQREFGVYSFERKFKVPKFVDAEKIEAHFENGILELVLPKKEEARVKPPVEIKIG
ncbi:heat shock protein Hsp20 [Mariniphaga anaerophila]|uniref:Heat shock protein Hsp20 n=1 Tax=Mariniphaga anaerophila TaxID=1484053 RepID=A0A1M4TUI1_9BACT|nr:Hsp20/alpha crystallin family protein [Mariniphaga anaerophila]SHE48112.1 heat shock protein Hsp20 [Mariniphaga anaerophila]